MRHSRTPKQHDNQRTHHCGGEDVTEHGVDDLCEPSDDPDDLPEEDNDEDDPWLLPPDYNLADEYDFFAEDDDKDHDQFDDTVHPTPACNLTLSQKTARTANIDPS